MPELLNREIRLVCRSVLRFVDRSFSTAMGCFFGCFRTRDDRRRPHLVSDSAPANPTEAVVSKNRLSSLFLEGEDYVQNDSESRSPGSTEINKELVNEAKFLKACGAIPKTPAEIRKASKKLNGSPPLNKDSESTEFHSWLPIPNTSIKKFQSDNQIHKSSMTNKLCEEFGHGSPSEHTPISCISNELSNGSKPFSIVDNATSLPVKNKSVRFECNIDTSSSKGSSENVFKVFQRSDSSGDSIASKRSPRPTPLTLSDEMQTPGTVYPASVEVLGYGKTRIRSQYVHPVLNPIENFSQLNELQQDDSITHELPNQLKYSIDQLENNVEGSLSSWFKPKQSDQDSDPINGISASENFCVGKTPMDRPIIGMVAAHWNEHESTNIFPKWWDGNGIPNSTNKYKEDQKVSWHATPFEERLEKALSEETFISQKLPMNGRPIIFDEQDENDTALSKLSSTNPKPVVSC